MDLDRIRDELMEIAKIVGPDDATGTRSGEDQGSRIDLPLIEIMKLAPHAFRQMGAVPPSIRVSVIVPDLFDQLTKGKVAVPLSTLIAKVPADNLSAEATMHGDETIHLPLPLVVANINPTELQRRTAKQEVDRGEKFLPNLFTPGSLKKPTAPLPAAPQAAIPTPTAPPAPRPPTTVTLPPSTVVTSTYVAPVPPPPARPPVVSTPMPPVAVPAPSTAAAVPPIVSAPVSEVRAAPAATPAPTRVQIPEKPAAPQPLSPPPARPTGSMPAPVAAPPPPVQSSVVKHATEVVEGAPVPSRTEIEAQQGKERKAAMEAEIEDAAAREHGLVLYGVDINHASSEERVARYNGVGRKLAEKIVANRVELGPYKDVYDLARVPGVKGKVFQRITGMAWPAALFRHRDQVAQLVGVTGKEIPDVRGVAQRFRELEGFTGCIMIDQDGLILASTWDHPSSEALGAFAPQMFKKLSRYVKQLKLGNIKTLTFFADDQPITLVTSGAILFVAVHKPTRFSKRQVELIQALATELGRKLQR